MVGIIAAILGALVAVFIGAWINNVFTWKIKAPIDQVDSIFSKLTKFENKFDKYDLGKSRVIAKDKINDDTNLDQKESEDLLEEMKLLIEDIDISNEILGNKFANNWSDIKTKFNDDYLAAHKNREFFSSSPSLTREKDWEYSNTIMTTGKKLRKLLRDFRKGILEYREELTSFKYVLKELSSPMLKFMCKHCNCSKKGNV